MLLIADSGSTKTDWAFVSDSVSSCRILHTQGLNPIHLSDAEITAVMKSVANSDGCNPTDGFEHSDDFVDAVYFYGSGVTPQQVHRVTALLAAQFPHAKNVEAASDMLGAARAVCGHEAGMACILGTGANSCLYDGTQMTANTPALGYILGDEGSGAVLGRLFLNGIFKGPLPTTLRDAYLSETNQTLADIINKVYRQPLANRYLASTSLFIAKHLDCAPLSDLVVSNFRNFLRINLRPYGHAEYPVGVIGSMGYHYADQLRTAAQQEGFHIGTIAKSPIKGLIDYHLVIDYHLGID